MYIFIAISHPALSILLYNEYCIFKAANSLELPLLSTRPLLPPLPVSTLEAPKGFPSPSCSPQVSMHQVVSFQRGIRILTLDCTDIVTKGRAWQGKKRATSRNGSTPLPGIPRVMGLTVTTCLCLHLLLQSVTLTFSKPLVLRNATYLEFDRQWCMHPRVLYCGTLCLVLLHASLLS